MHPETNWDLWMIDMATGETQPIHRTAAEEIQPIILPNGDLLAYTTNETGNRQVYVELFPDGGRKRRISTAGGEDPLWSRDGSTLYYRWQNQIYAVPVSATETSDAELVYQGLFEGRAGYGKVNWDVDEEGRFLLADNLPDAMEPEIRVILGWLAQL